MPIVSIKRYLNSSLEDTLRRTVSFLIEKLGECAVENDAEELATFRDDILELAAGLTPDLPQQNIVTLAETAAELLGNYNKQVSKAIGKQTGDLQAIVKILQENLLKMAGESTESVQSLGKIVRDLERGAGFKDLQALKMHLGSCLSGLREEIQRERDMSKAMIERLQIEIESLYGPGGNPLARRVDRATGLPNHEECLMAFQQAIDRGTRHYAVVMVVNRVQPINARFGKEAGDWMLAQFREYIETQLIPADQLFRWTGPAMVALLERAQALDQVRGLVKRMLESPVNRTYDVNGRTIFIPITAAWSAVMLDSTVEAAEKQIQKFIASQGCRDFA
jgi:GGDEF domain-containing protein